MHSLDVMMSLDPFCHTLQQRNAQPVLITQTCAECSNATEHEGFDSPSLHHPVKSRATHSCNVDRTHLCKETKCETVRRYWKYVSYRNFYHLLNMVVRRRHTCKEVFVDARQPLIEYLIDFSRTINAQYLQKFPYQNLVGNVLSSDVNMQTL